MDWFILVLHWSVLIFAGLIALIFSSLFAVSLVIAYSMFNDDQVSRVDVYEHLLYAQLYLAISAVCVRAVGIYPLRLWEFLMQFSMNAVIAIGIVSFVSYANRDTIPLSAMVARWMSLFAKRHEATSLARAFVIVFGAICVLIELFNTRSRDVVDFAGISAYVLGAALTAWLLSRMVDEYLKIEYPSPNN